MRHYFFLAFLACFQCSTAWGQDKDSLPNSGQIQVGSNYFGQSVALAYSRNLAGPLWAEVALETQSISFQSAAGQNFFVFYNSSYTNFNIGLDVHDFVTLDLAFHRSNQGEFRVLNSLAVGITHFDLTYHLSFNGADPSDVFRGQRDISAFALYTDLHLLDFYPSRDRLFFSLGIKGNTAFLPSPQTVDAKDGSGQTASISYASEDGGAIMFPDLELYLGLGYGFE